MLNSIRTLRVTSNLLAMLALWSSFAWANPTMMPLPVMKVTGLSVEGKSVESLDGVEIQPLPTRKPATTRLAIGSLLTRGSIIAVPGRASVRLQSNNGVLIRLGPGSKLYVDAVAEGQEIYDLILGSAWINMPQPLRMLAMKHGSIAGLARAATFKAEVVRPDVEFRYTVERGDLDVEQRVNLVDGTRKRPLVLYERSTLQAGQSLVASDDQVRRKELRFDDETAIDKYVRDQLREAEDTRNPTKIATALRRAVRVALHYQKIKEAIGYFERWAALPDSLPLELSSFADSIAYNCGQAKDDECALTYYRKSLALTASLYPDGLHGAVAEIGLRAAKLRAKLESAEQVGSALADAEKLRTRWLEGTDRSPKIVERAPVNYPRNMQRWGIGAQGLVEFIVGEDGQARDLRVLQSPHPAFELAIVKSILASKYKPATLEGVPIAAKITMPFTFSFESSIKPDGESAYEFSPATDPKLPHGLQYDQPPRVKVAGPVVYPRHLVESETTGSARLAIALDTKGNVRGVKLLEATHPDFGAAAVAMMQAWEFLPARKNQAPVESVFVFTQKFRWDERDTGLGTNTRLLLRALASKSNEVVETSALDSNPRILYQTQPVDPRPATGAGALPEDVVIEFFIDPDGMVQLPRVISAKSLELGWAAATAVRRWVFETPRVKGEPVFARRELRFSFQ